MREWEHNILQIRAAVRSNSWKDNWNKVCVYELSKEQEDLPIIINTKPTEIDSSCMEDIITDGFCG